MGVTLWPVESAGVHHPDVAERKVVADRIVRVERAQGGGNLGGHLPPGRRVVGQAQAVAESNDVSVERDNQA